MKSRMPASSLLHNVTWCPDCGKRSYAHRKAAKAEIRRINGTRMREYRCPTTRTYFHIGHLPDAVVTGKVTAPEIYRRRSA